MPEIPLSAQARHLRIMPIGDSITRGSYLAKYQDGPFAGCVIGLPNSTGGGWRKPLQDKLRTAGVHYEFVGSLDYHAYGENGILDPYFSPRHQGLAGFSNQQILSGGIVPTPPDVLKAKGVSEIWVPSIVTVLAEYHPDVILLMSGANGFDSSARDLLFETILKNFKGSLIVATVPPQSDPRDGWQQVSSYNQTLPGEVAKLKAAGNTISMVDMEHALTLADLSSDGVHPTQAGMETMATIWFLGLCAAGLVSSNHNKS